MTVIPSGMELKVCLNVGSGQRRFKSTPTYMWINIDSQTKPGHEPDIQCDGAHLTMYQDGDVDYVVLHHVLEHFGCNEGIGLVQEAHRILKPGGSLLVFVPDLRMLAHRWFTTRFDTQLFMTNVYGAYMGDEADRHKWGFDRDSLYHFLHDATQWHSVKMFNWREIPGMEAARDWWICGMECVR